MIDLNERQWTIILDSLSFFGEHSNPDYDYEKSFEEQECIGDSGTYTQQEVEDVSEIVMEWMKQYKN